MNFKPVSAAPEFGEELHLFYLASSLFLWEPMHALFAPSKHFPLTTNDYPLASMDQIVFEGPRIGVPEDLEKRILKMRRALRREQGCNLWDCFKKRLEPPLKELTKSGFSDWSVTASKAKREFIELFFVAISEDRPKDRLVGGYLGKCQELRQWLWALLLNVNFDLEK